MQKFVKVFGMTIILILCAVFILRCILVADKSTFSDLALTPALSAAYTDENAADFVKTVKVAREIADDGYFSAYALYYIPAAGEIQVSVRWNDSVYGYTDMPEDTEFSFELLNETTGISYPASAISEKEMAMYNYRKLVVDGVPLLGENDQLTVVMNLRDGFTSKQVVRFSEQPYSDYRLSGKEKKQLSGIS